MNIYFIFQVIATLAETIIEAGLITPYLRSKYKRSFTVPAFFAFLFVHNFFFLVLIGYIPTWALLTEVVIFYSAFAVFIGKCYQGSAIYDYCKVFEYRFVIRIIGTVITIIPVILLNQYDAAAKTGGGTDSGNLPGRIVMWISYPCVYFLGKIVFKWYNSKERRGDKILALLFAIADLLTTLGIGVRALSFLPIILIVAIVIFFFIQESDEAEIRSNYSFYQELLENTQSQESKLSVIRHDLANHLSAVEQLESEDTAGELIDSLNRSKHKWTGIPIVDCLLTEKKRLAGQKNIMFDIESILFTADEKHQVNLVTIFSNIIDNGIEACERVNGSTSCNLSVSISGEYLCIILENDKSPEEKPLKSGFATTKKDSSRHGYGHRILKRTVNNMDGRIFYEDKGERFLTKVLVIL